MADDEEKQLRLELLAADLKLRRKQEFWETPRNIAILVGVSAAIAAALGFWLGRESAAPPAPALSPVFGLGNYNKMNGAQFIDSVQTASLCVLTLMIIYVVVRLDRTLTSAAEKLKGAIGEQQEIMRIINRVFVRLESIERLVWERNEILPTAKLGQTLEEIRSRLERLEENKRKMENEHMGDT